MLDIELCPYTGHDGHRLYLRRLIPEAPRAAVLLIHGYSGHSGRFERAIRKLGDGGLAVYCPDHRGHGLSGPTPGFIERMDDLVADLKALRGEIARATPDLPVFVYGHSMGGMLSVLLLGEAAEGFHGAILSAPAVVTPPSVSRAVRALAHAMGRALPRMGVRRYFDPTLAARSPEAQRSMVEDPLFYKGPVRARTASEILKAVERADRLLPTLSLPLLVIHGEKDRVVPLEASHRVMTLTPSADKTLRTWPDGFHQLMDDPEWEEVLEAAMAWMTDRCAPRAAEQDPRNVGSESL